MRAAELRSRTLNERDAARDMRACGREVLAAYASALGEKLPRGLRGELLRLFAEAAESCARLTEGEEELPPRDAFAAFSRRKKQLGKQE